jgi:hypothetical protein
MDFAKMRELLHERRTQLDQTLTLARRKISSGEGARKAGESVKPQIKEYFGGHGESIYAACNVNRISGANDLPREMVMKTVYSESTIAEMEAGEMFKLQDVFGEEVCILADPDRIRFALTGARTPVSDR